MTIFVYIYFLLNWESFIQPLTFALIHIYQKEKIALEIAASRNTYELPSHTRTVPCYRVTE